MDAFLIQGLSVLAILGGFGYWKFIGQHQVYLRQICAGLLLGGPRVDPDRSGTSSGWRLYSYQGIYQDRRILVDYRYHMTLRAGGFSDELEIRIPVIQKFWLRMLPQATEDEYREEIIVNQDTFDRSYRIHANQREAATEFLQSRVIQERFQKLPVPVDRFEIHQGWLRALFLRPKERVMMRSDFESILDHLILLTVAYERQSYHLEITAGQEISSLCPYCRSEMIENEIVVECAQCSTHLHEACWKENKQCTTWGCNSTQAK